MAKKDLLRETVEKIWPKTKKELEKGIKNAKEMLSKGEKYLKEVSEQGVKQTKKLSLNLKREKLYYDLGKAVALSAANEWKSDQKINILLKEIRALNEQIKKIK